MSSVPNFLISADAVRSVRAQVVALFAVLVLLLVSGCGSTDAGQATGGDVGWSTGGGGNANADPVPSRPALSPEAPQSAQRAQRSEAPSSVPSAAARQDEAAPAAEGAETSDSPPASGDSSTTGAAVSELNGLDVRGKEHRTGYDPQEFDWRSDADHNGCDTPNDVLRRDLDKLVLEAGSNGCTVAAGRLDDKYLGDSYEFERGSSKIEIDHIVSRSNAWQTGAAGLTYDELREFSNDPLNLLAVSSTLKRQKSEGDAASWLPPNEDYRCEYVSRQIAVKQKYGLWVAAAEKDAMEEVLDSCAGHPSFSKDVNWPQPGEGDGVTTESASQESSGEPSEGPSDPAEETAGNSAGDSSAKDSAGDSSTAKDSAAGDSPTGESPAAPPPESAETPTAPATESAGDGRRGER